MQRYTDRADAGRKLAPLLSHLREEDVVVLGLPRGGVPVAFEVARELRAPFDVLLARTLTVPDQPGLAFGAVGERGVRINNDAVIQQTGLTYREMDDVENREWEDLIRRGQRFRKDHGRISLKGRIALIVDDGVATGATAQAACQVARAQGARRVVLAVPIVAADVAKRLTEYADDVVCAQKPVPHFAVAHGYRDFAPVSDDDVAALLDRARNGFVSSTVESGHSWVATSP
ncbi:phosphoribosyltransferase [Mycobacterium vicinigordonae]|uniref:Phosphoribosyltransferase domain-containing protein n=1 Tax=Mycobacterium vicinigordonae TaxID=1719132 RepID=A0A7D6IB92_9MYCO|nr:phosphoribosyltransferase family protein [Mycobacterium vicinigordonae]QLL09417.1 hypothetical protein H0P51_11390 [Mycobacterium vicinigordonae]